MGRISNLRALCKVLCEQISYEGNVAVCINDESVSTLFISVRRCFHFIDRSIRVSDDCQAEARILVCSDDSVLPASVQCVVHITLIPSASARQFRWIALLDPMRQQETEILASDERLWPSKTVLHFYAPAANIIAPDDDEQLVEMVTGVRSSY